MIIMNSSIHQWSCDQICPQKNVPRSVPSVVTVAGSFPQKGRRVKSKDSKVPSSPPGEVPGETQGGGLWVGRAGRSMIWRVLVGTLLKVKKHV